MYVLCSMIMPTPAQLRSARSLRCSVYIEHKATIRPTAITPNVQNARQVIKDTPYPCSMLNCPSHARSRQCNSPSINAPANTRHLSTSQIGFASPCVLVFRLHEFRPPLTYDDFPRSTPPTHQPPALTISITVTTSFSSRGA